MEEGVRVLWQQQQGLVWVSKAIVQQPRPRDRGSKRWRGGLLGGTARSLRSVGYSVGAVLGQAGEVPRASLRCLRLQEGDILKAFNNACGQNTCQCEWKSKLSAGAPCSARP